MKVRITQSCLAIGEHREAGTVAELPDDVAQSLLRSNRAERVPELGEIIIQTREPEGENRDPKPLRKKSAKA